MFAEAFFDILRGVQLLPLFDSLPGKYFMHLLLLKERTPAILFLVAFLVLVDHLHDQVEANLRKWQGHEHFAFEVSQASDKRKAIQIVEGAGKHDVNITNVNDVQMAQLELGCCLVYEVFTVYLLIQFGPLAFPLSI